MRRGFTLIELIIVIGLIAVIGALIVVNAQAILRGLGEEPLERSFQKAVREARFQAASLKEPAFLRYDDEAGVLGVFSERGAALASFRLSGEDARNPPEISFRQILPAEGLEPSREDTVAIKAIVFRPDRSSTPFEVTISDGRDSFTQRYDPFSAIVIEDSRDD